MMLPTQGNVLNTLEVYLFIGIIGGRRLEVGG